MRRSASAALAAVALLLVAGAASAQAATRAELTSYADRAAAAWAHRQDPATGEFLDPHSGRPSGGYGNVFLGYSLMRAGERRGDPKLIAAGVRGVNSSLGEPPGARGVFDLLSMAAAYDFALRVLRSDPAVAAALPRWEGYLRETGPPNIENKARACILSPDCFHNHEAVEAAADLQLAATGVDPPALGGAQALRARAAGFVGTEEPRFATGSARVLGPRSRSGLGLLSDTGSWPLAYHALCTAMLARSLQLLGTDAPPPARVALHRTSAALAGFMAPDGDVAYIGRRQQTIWALAATIVATENEAPAAADRAFTRLRERYPLTRLGLPIVPRRGPDAFSPRGVDSRPMVFNGLALYLLNVAADAAGSGQRATGGQLPLDRDGAFVDPAQARFAAVRRGDVWFAVHARRNPPDLRYDSGLVAAKFLTPRGWIDLVPPRPFVLDGRATAGPLIMRGGEVLHPAEGPIRVARDGTVVSGVVRFAPTTAGVRISLPARGGDTVVYNAYGHTVAHARTARTGLASCCALDITERRLRVRVRTSGLVAIQVGSAARRNGRPAPGPGHGASNWLTPALAVLVLVLALALALTRRRKRLKPL